MRVANLLCPALAFLSSSSVVACENADFHWKGAAFLLPSGAPVNTCERAEWYEVARAWLRARVRSRQSGATYTRVYEGLAVFRYRSSDPERLDAVVPKMGEPDLEQNHRPYFAGPQLAVIWARNKLFIEGEESEETVVRGIDHANEQRRRQCAEAPNETQVPGGPAPHEW